MFSSDRNAMRRVFLDAWRKTRIGAPMEPLEQLVAAVVNSHPEYHRFLKESDDALGRDFIPEQGQTNPFLHMGMHISLREQVGVDRPPGIAVLFRGLVERLGDSHAAEHQMMECLGLALWEAQRAGRIPDEQAYLECLRRLAGVA
jgi:hypothetical protein